MPTCWSPSSAKKDSYAVYFLQRQGISRLDVVNFISHGVTKAAQPPTPGAATDGEQAEGSKKVQGQAAPENHTQNLNQLALVGKIDR